MSEDQKVTRGEGSLETLREILDERGARRVFLVTGTRSFEATGLAARVDQLLQGLTVERFFGFPVNPKLEAALDGAKRLEAFEPDAVVGIGGGSVLDTAKLCRALPPEEERTGAVLSGSGDLNDPPVPMIAIPTTAGSGSEATHFAVVYADGRKYSVAAQPMLPETVILDPELTYSADRYLTIVTAWDALAQAIESFWARGATGESRTYAASSLETSIAVLPRLYRERDADSRRRMLYAAHDAGRAINISKTTAPHAMSYALTIGWGVPHGHAAALLLCEFFRYHAEMLQDSRAADLPPEFGEIIRRLAGFFGESDPLRAAGRLEELLSSSGVTLDPRDLGIPDRETFLATAGKVNAERLRNHPVVLKHEEMESLLARLWPGKR